MIAKKFFTSINTNIMDIRINNFTNFQSKANPIQPFVIKTKHGKLKVCEVTQREIRRKGFFDGLTKFFCKNFASSTKDSNWQVFNNRKSLDYERVLNDFTKYYEAKVKHNDENMTLLLVKDKRNKIHGACLSYGYDRISGVKDKVCYIDSIAVAPAYRGKNIGKILVEKTLESAKNKYTDAFLAGDRESAGFYEKLGFIPLDYKEEGQKTIIDYMSRRRVDYPKYVELYTKPLQESEERWYNSITDNII